MVWPSQRANSQVTAPRSTKSSSEGKRFRVRTNATLQITRNFALSSTTQLRSMVYPRLNRQPLLRPASVAWMAIRASASRSWELRTTKLEPQRSRTFSKLLSVIHSTVATTAPFKRIAAWLMQTNGRKLLIGTSSSTTGPISML